MQQAIHIIQLTLMPQGVMPGTPGRLPGWQGRGVPGGRPPPDIGRGRPWGVSGRVGAAGSMSAPGGGRLRCRR